MILRRRIMKMMKRDNGKVEHWEKREIMIRWMNSTRRRRIMRRWMSRRKWIMRIIKGNQELGSLN